MNTTSTLRSWRQRVGLAVLTAVLAAGCGPVDLSPDEVNQNLRVGASAPGERPAATPPTATTPTAGTTPLPTCSPRALAGTSEERQATGAAAATPCVPPKGDDGSTGVIRRATTEGDLDSSNPMPGIK